MWVKRPKGAEFPCRLVCKGCYKATTDRGDAYASTPLLITLNLLILIGLTKNYSFTFYDVHIAFLHAELKEQVYVRTAEEFYPDSGVVWKLRAMYGLKTAPKAW